MKNVASVFALTLLTTLFYFYVGQMVPQKETHPPKGLQLSDDMSTDDMVAAGQTIFEGKGTCTSCHTIGSASKGLRFPDLGSIGATAGKKKKGMNALDYLTESMCEPNAFIAKGFNPGMPAMNVPPVNLNLKELKVVLAYLESLGSTAKITMGTKIKCEASAGGAAAPAPAPIASAGGKGGDHFTTYGCITCHDMKAKNRMVGPPLSDAGKRLNKAQLYESLMDPDATIAKGFPPGVMGATLKANGFYTKLKPTDIQAMVEKLAGMKK